MESNNQAQAVGRPLSIVEQVITAYDERALPSLFEMDPGMQEFKDVRVFYDTRTGLLALLFPDKESQDKFKYADESPKVEDAKP